MNWRPGQGAWLQRVFLSSTGADLRPHRDAVSQAIRRADYQLIQMEDFTAQAGETTLQYCRRLARDCDIFVGLLAHCYGSIPDGHRESYTEQEYQAAREIGKPRLMFLAPEDFPVPARLIRDQPPEHAEKQKRFRVRAAQDQHPGQPDAFETADKLATNVLAALHQLRFKQPVGSVTTEPAGVEPERPGSAAQLVSLLDRRRQSTMIHDRLDALRRTGKGGGPLLFRVIGCLPSTDGCDGRAAGVR